MAAISRCSIPRSSIFPTARPRSSRFPGRSQPINQNAEYDLHLNNGRLLEHFHEGNMTYRTEGIREKTPCTFVEVSPELANERGIQTGSWVQLTSRYGKVRAQAVITTRVQGKELYMPMNSTAKSRSTGSPAATRTKRPTPRPTRRHPCNSRCWERSARIRCRGPTPATDIRHRRHGVEVERKWKRKDYRQPGDQLVQIQTR